MFVFLFAERRVTCQLKDVTLPKHTETNPIYEQIEGTDELMMHHNNIVSLGTVTDELPCNSKEPYNNGKVCNDKSCSPPPIPKNPVGDDVERDEYIQMSALTSEYPNRPCSISPHYTETPGTVAKGDVNENFLSLQKALP